jgi:hypothetical protein
MADSVADVLGRMTTDVVSPRPVLRRIIVSAAATAFFSPSAEGSWNVPRPFCMGYSTGEALAAGCPSSLDPLKDRMQVSMSVSTGTL